MANEQQTILFSRHLALGAQMVPFGGWLMPLAYPTGILKEHLTTRRQAGLFDVSHMGRFEIRGRQALPFLQYLLTNNAAALQIGQSHYTLMADEKGGAVDDAYLFRFVDDRYLLVVNAANRSKDWKHLDTARVDFKEVVIEDQSAALAMLSVQGPDSETILAALIDDGQLPAPRRNALSIAAIDGAALWLSRTGYTGEPRCFELMVASARAASVWNRLIELGAQPVGLGARDTLRLEAGLPLYGHELGLSPDGEVIPIFALSLARFAVSFAPDRGDFIGKAALWDQFQAAQGLSEADIKRLPRRVRCLELIDPGIARAGAQVFFQDQPAGFVTSGTMVPYWRFEGQGGDARITEQSERRAIALALVDRRIQEGDSVQIDIRGKTVNAGVMSSWLNGKTPPFAQAVTWQHHQRQRQGRP